MQSFWAGRAGALVLGCTLVASCGSSDPVSSGACVTQRWVTAWEAPPTDAIAPIDASLTPLLSGPLQTFRLMLSPLGSGETVRVHLSNRFGLTPVTFTAVRIARQAQSGTAEIDAQSSVQLSFGGQAAITIPAGAEVISDATVFHFQGLDNLAVSIAAAAPSLLPTHHFEARQHSFATLPGVGDYSADVDGDAFVQSTTTRPFVTAVDTLSDSAAAVVAFGDSLTDGHQGPATLVPQDTATIDQNERYPDYLFRRLAAANRPLFVANAGISGNRVLQNGQLPVFGPSALARIDLDALADAGVSDAILFEGINDIAQTPPPTAQQLAGGYTQLIAALHDHGINVIQATLTPAGSSTNPDYSGAASEALRQQVNTWIRSQSPADSIVDFDAAVRDPANPAVIAAQYDGGDGLHFNAAGYQRLAAAVDLAKLRGNTCSN